MSSYRLDKVLLVIYKCKFCRGGSGVTSGKGSGFCITMKLRAILRLICSNSLHRKTFLHHPPTDLSGSRSQRLLAVPYSENGPQGDTFRNHGGHRIECDGRIPEVSKRSLPHVLPTIAGSIDQVVVLFRRCLVKHCLCPSVTAQYHNSGNFLTAHPIFLRMSLYDIV
jgi:hypothetical protein